MILGSDQSGIEGGVASQVQIGVERFHLDA